MLSNPEDSFLLNANLSQNLKCSTAHLSKLKIAATFKIMTIDSCLTPDNTEIDERSGSIRLELMKERTETETETATHRAYCS